MHRVLLLFELLDFEQTLTFLGLISIQPVQALSRAAKIDAIDSCG
jgi:hypothetical protein